MEKKETTAKDYIQGLAGFWVVMLGILYLGNQALFYDMLYLSLVGMGLALILAAIVRKRRFGYVFRPPAGLVPLDKLRKMSAFEFDDFTADLYRRLGYETHRVGEGGVDVTAEKKGIINYVKCGPRDGQKVGVEKIMALKEAMSNQPQAGQGIYITTDDFSAGAAKYAAGNKVELAGVKELLGMIKEAGIKDDGVDFQ